MIESCRICGGDGRIANSFGSETTCPGCHGTGRRADDIGFRDVTKTKPSHYRTQTAKSAAPERDTGPSTHEGAMLAKEVQASPLSNVSKAKLLREIVEYEGSHGKITETFAKKVRKQLREQQA